MNRYTVVWSQDAEDKLAELWTDSSDRQAVTDAANAIDRELAVDPEDKGTPMSEGMRSLDVPPLHVLFAVQAADRLVLVALVRRLDRASPSGNGNGRLLA